MPIAPLRARSVRAAHLLAVAALLGSAGPALAADPLTAPARKPNERGPRPAVVQKLYDCRTIADATARLACFDAGVADLAAADERRDLTLATREDIRQARRGLFGLNLPRFGLFGGGDNDDGDVDEIKEVETVIEDARPLRQGGWSFTVDGGVRWSQTDQQAMLRDPKPGMKVKIRRAAMGSFFANVDGQRAIRVKREN